MTYKIRELESLTSIDVNLDLTEYVPNVIDLIDLKDVNVKGTIDKEYDAVIFELQIEALVVQKCNISLKPVSYPISFETRIIYSKNEEIMDFILEDEIDFSTLVFSEILLEKEPVVYHEDADLDRFKEAEKKGHPAFQALKKTK